MLDFKKKEMKIMKKKMYDEKQKKGQKSMWAQKLAFFILTSPHWLLFVAYSKL